MDKKEKIRKNNFSIWRIQYDKHSEPIFLTNKKLFEGLSGNYLG